jgi:hypothetical protein
MNDNWSGGERRKDVKELTELTTKLLTLHNDVHEIKTALKELTSAITKLALIEERQTVTNASLERAFVAIDRIEIRLSEVEKLVPINSQARVWVERFVIALCGAMLLFIWEKVKR